MTTENYARNLFRFNIFILKRCGLWVPDKSGNCKNKERNFHIFYNGVCFLFGAVWFNYAEIMKIPDTYTNLPRLIEQLGMILTVLLGTYKILSYFMKRQRINAMIATLEDPQYQYKPGKDFDPVTYIERARKISYRVTMFFLCFAMSVPSSNELISMLHWSKVNEEDLERGNVTCEDVMPYFIWFPLPTNKKGNCGLAILAVVLPGTILAWQITAHDTLYVSLLTYARAHFEIIQRAFQTLRERCLQDLNLPKDYQIFCNDQNPELEKRINEEVEKCTRHLQSIIGLCEEVESCFTIAILGQTLVSLFVLSSCLFTVSSVPIFSGTFAAQFVYMNAIIIQLTFYCWFGNQITNATEELPTYMYSSNWLTSSARTKKSMLINMMRLQKPVYLTVGKFTPLTLNTLVAIVKGGYSYYAMLKNTSQKKEG